MIVPPSVFWAGTACRAKLKAKPDDRPYDYGNISSVSVFRKAGHRTRLPEERQKGDILVPFRETDGGRASGLNRNCLNGKNVPPIFPGHSAHLVIALFFSEHLHADQHLHLLTDDTHLDIFAASHVVCQAVEGHSGLEPGDFLFLVKRKILFAEVGKGHR